MFVCVKFCCKLGKNFTDTFRLLNQVYGKDCMSWTQCYEWFKYFKEGRMSVGEDSRPRQPSAWTNDDHFDWVCAVIRGNCRLTVRQVAGEVGISIGSCHQIFPEKLQMRRVSAKFTLHLLTDDDQKENRAEISQELLANVNGNENFLKNIITRWDMGLWVWCWNQDAIVAVDGERVSSTKKRHRWISQRSRWWWLCFLIGKALSTMHLYHMVRW